MLRSLSTMLVVLGLLFAVPQPAQAQIQPKAYAPENLRNLSRSDQERVIGLEYSEQSRGRRIPDDQLRFYLDQVNRSNWGFSRIKQDIATSLGSGNGGWNPEPPPFGGQTLRCDSKDNDARRCVPPWRGPSRLVRQISNSPCIENRTWNSQDGLITVWKGCRGEFAAASTSTDTIRCESTNNRYRECRTHFRGHATLTRKFSDARCTEGQTWGQRNGMIWVDRGCRAEFAESNGGWNPGGDSNYSVTCSSQNNRRTTCAWISRYGRPYLIQQLSSDSCREGSTWGYLRGNLWVDRGCRARFGAR